MIGPTAHDIIALRWRVRVVLRVLAMMLLVAALAWAAARMPEYLDLLAMSTNQRHAATGAFPAPRFFSLEWFAIPGTMLAGAVMTILLAQFGLWLLVPAPPKPDCPACGYDLSNPTGDRCPECGLRLGPRSANDHA